MILIAGTIDLDPAQRDAALAGARPYIEGALTQAGCIAYAWTADPELPGRIHVFEEWTDADALEAHFADRHYADMRRHLGQCGIRVRKRTSIRSVPRRRSTTNAVLRRRASRALTLSRDGARSARDCRSASLRSS